MKQTYVLKTAKDSGWKSVEASSLREAMLILCNDSDLMPYVYYAINNVELKELEAV